MLSRTRVIGGMWGRRWAAVAALIASAWMATGAPTARAASVSVGCAGGVGDTDALVRAIRTANLGGQTTIDLIHGCTYTVASASTSWYGPDALPAIAAAITIDGHGATIARNFGAPPFRFFYVGADPGNPKTFLYASPGTGDLTLRDLTLSGGLAQGGSGGPSGGGGAGLGGAIYNQGALTLDSVTLSDDRAQGGAGGNPASSGTLGGGGGLGQSGGTSSGGGMGGVLLDRTGSPATVAAGGAGGTIGGGGGGGGFGATALFCLFPPCSGEDGSPSPGHSGGSGGGNPTGTGGAGGGAPANGLGGDGSGGGGAGANGSGGSGGAFGAGGAAGSSGQSGGGGGGVGGGGAPSPIGGAGGGGGFGGGGGGAEDTPAGDGGFGGGGGGTGSLGPAAGGGFGAGTGGLGPASLSPGPGGGGAGLGGAIFNNQGTVTITNSTLSGNSAAGGASNANPGQGLGGAIFNLDGRLTITSSTLADNAVGTDGAAVYDLAYDEAFARTADDAISDGILSDPPRAGVAELIVAQPAAVADGGANVSSAAANVAAHDLVRSAATVGSGTISGSPATADPQLGPLQGNGGPGMWTMAIGPGSPALAAGAGCPSSDERGTARPPAECDLGAFEAVLPPAVTGTSVTAVTLDSAQLHALATPGDRGASAAFDFGLTPSYGSQTASQSLGAAMTATVVSATVSHLRPGTLYYFQVVATNSDGIATSAGAFTTGPAPIAGHESLTPPRFRAKPSGPSVFMHTSKRHASGSAVSFTLSANALVTFTVTMSVTGTRSKGGHCAAGTPKRHKLRCMRNLKLPGSFTLAGAPGTNRFGFSGRLRGKPLKPGRYTLLATPAVDGYTGAPATATFTILR